MNWFQNTVILGIWKGKGWLTHHILLHVWYLLGILIVLNILLILLDISLSSWVNFAKIIFISFFFNKIEVLLLTSWGKSWIYNNFLMSGHSCFKSSEEVEFKMIALGNTRIFLQSWLWIVVVINIFTFLSLLWLHFWKGRRNSILFKRHAILNIIGNCLWHLCIIELFFILFLRKNIGLRNLSGRFINSRNNIFNYFSWDKILIIIFFQGILLRLNLFRYIHCLRYLDRFELRVIFLINKRIWFKVVCISDGSMV